MVIFLDIDGTLTDYRAGSLAPRNLLHGNFLFPILQDFLVRAGLDSQEASSRILKETQSTVFWNYTGLMDALEIPREPCIALCRKWHRDNLLVYPDTVEFVHWCAEHALTVYIISNNPVDGCRWKLEVAGLYSQDDGLFPGIQGIFGTDIMLGCKFRAECWQRAFSLAGLSAENVMTMGDDFHEDGEIPRSIGVARSFILRRGKTLPPSDSKSNIFPIDHPMDCPWKVLQVLN